MTPGVPPARPRRPEAVPWLGASVGHEKPAIIYIYIYIYIITYIYIYIFIYVSIYIYIYL